MLLAILGTRAIRIVQAVCPFAVPACFRTHHPETGHWFRTLVAPLVGGVAMFAVVALLIPHMSAVAGPESGSLVLKAAPGLVAAVAALGVAYAPYVKRPLPQAASAAGAGGPGGDEGALTPSRLSAAGQLSAPLAAGQLSALLAAGQLSALLTPPLRHGRSPRPRRTRRGRASRPLRRPGGVWRRDCSPPRAAHASSPRLMAASRLVRLSTVPAPLMEDVSVPAFLVLVG